MAKYKPVTKMQTYGIHSQWQSKSKDLPSIQAFTTDIPAEIDTVWSPIADKCGDWRMTIELDNKILADKNFNISPEHC